MATTTKAAAPAKKSGTPGVNIGARKTNIGSLYP